ncbi:hypothetical protein [Pseudooceanicola sp.]|uniref:hypothetical protein n=1 Tax=Pseudooceanicola sp. TaxID=1914328 RepID=UPI0026062DDB|nr:hypothetical protein [Pseudooceanicola sp.]MDF1855466.1 hypothetical protein [Pseudooceanicola sp.]
MSESEAHLDELQGRIQTALDRIGDAVAGIDSAKAAAPQVDPAALMALQQALESEKLANAQLEERLRTLKARQEDAANQTDRALADQRAAMVQLDQDLQRLRMANDQLRDSNRALREANETGVGEPDLINSAMQAELDALRAARSVDRSEADAIVTALVPLVANGASGGDH